MVLIGSISWVRGVLLFTIQIVGGICAAALVKAIFPGELNVHTELNPAMSLAQGTVLEMLLTAQLVFTIFMLAAEKHTGTFIAPVGIGLSLFIAELVGMYLLCPAFDASCTLFISCTTQPLCTVTLHIWPYVS